MMTIRYCLSCRRPVGCGLDARFCPCGKSWSGKRCRLCLILSDASATVCSGCGRKEGLAEPTRSINLTGPVRLLSLLIALLLLREILAHLPLIAGWGLQGLSWLFLTTPDTLLLPLIGTLKVAPLVLLFSFLIPGGARLRGLMWAMLKGLVRLSVVAARGAFWVIAYLTNGPKPPPESKTKK